MVAGDCSRNPHRFHHGLIKYRYRTFEFIRLFRRVEHGSFVVGGLAVCRVQGGCWVSLGGCGIPFVVNFYYHLCRQHNALLILGACALVFAFYFRFRHLSHPQSFLGAWSSSMFPSIAPASRTSLTRRPFSGISLSWFVWSPGRWDGAGMCHMGSCPWTFFAGFAVASYTLRHSAIFSVALRSSSGVDPFFSSLPVSNDWDNSGFRGVVYFVVSRGTSVAICASVSYVQIVLSSLRIS